MANNRLHAFRLNKYAYLGVDASDKDSVHLLLVGGDIPPTSEEDALEGTAVEALRTILEHLPVSVGVVTVDGQFANSYPLEPSTLDILHALCDLSAKASYRYQRVRSLSMQAELPLGVG